MKLREDALLVLVGAHDPPFFLHQDEVEHVKAEELSIPFLNIPFVLLWLFFIQLTTDSCPLPHLGVSAPVEEKAVQLFVQLRARGKEVCVGSLFACV